MPHDGALTYGLILARSQKLTRMNNRPHRLLAYLLARHLEILVRGLLVEQRFPKPLQSISPCILQFRFMPKFRRF
jgi:hypothetical protein